MHNVKKAKILSGIVIFTGTMVMVGWFLGIPILTSILPQWVTMKFSTALSFFLSGTSLFFIAKIIEEKPGPAKLVLPVTSLVTLLLMATLLFSVFIGVPSGIEDWFVQEAEGAVKTTTPGRPSSGTMINFIVLGVAGIAALFNLANLRKYLNWMGWVVVVIGTIAVMGYITDQEILYYTISSWSTAMAFHTAILFILLGTGLTFLGKSNLTNFILGLKIRTKLTSGFLLVALLVAVVGYVGLINQQQTVFATEYYDRMSIPALSLLGAISSKMEEMNVIVLDSILEGDTDVMKGARDEYTQVKGELELHIDEYTALTSVKGAKGNTFAPELMQYMMQKFAEEMRESLHSIDSLAQEIFILINAREEQGQLSQFRDFGYGLGDERGKFRDIVARAIAMGMEARENRSEIIEASLKNAPITILVSTVLALLSALFIGFFLSSYIVRRIMINKDAAAEIAGGNLKHRIEIIGKDEIGQVAMSFNAMAVKLQKSYGALEEKVRKRTAELEMAKNKSEALLASMGDGVFAIDKEQKIVHLNKRGQEMSGYESTEVLGKPYYDSLKFIKEKDGSENIEFIRQALKGKQSKMTDHTNLVRKDGRKLPVADSAAPLKNKDGETIGVIVVFRDSTEERELEKMREQIISLTTHQLRSPITIIRGYAELLKEADLPKESKRQLEQISLVTASMHELINDLLDLSRMEQGKIDMAPAPTRLEDLVKGITKGLKEISEKEGKAIRIGETKALPKVSIDAKHVSEALTNVISNAVKYTKDDVLISFEQIDGFVQFSCTDNGLGIPKDEQYSIFKNFYRASNVKKTGIEGTGLGLSIAKAIVEKSGGRIWFDSEVDKGTTFYVTLPIA